MQGTEKDVPTPPAPSGKANELSISSDIFTKDSNYENLHKNGRKNGPDNDPTNRNAWLAMVKDVQGKIWDKLSSDQKDAIGKATMVKDASKLGVWFYNEKQDGYKTATGWSAGATVDQTKVPAVTLNYWDINSDGTEQLDKNSTNKYAFVMWSTDELSKTPNKVPVFVMHVTINPAN